MFEGDAMWGLLSQLLLGVDVDCAVDACNGRGCRCVLKVQGLLGLPSGTASVERRACGITWPRHLCQVGFREGVGRVWELHPGDRSVSHVRISCDVDIFGAGGSDKGSGCFFGSRGVVPGNGEGF